MPPTRHSRRCRTPLTINRLTALYQAYRTAQTAATAAAGDLFADEPLPKIGSDVWRALWEAARRYSEQQAYPDTPFPVTGDGARCVLCQQELDAEAANRLARFEAFVKDETKRKEELAAAAYRAALDELTGADVPAAKIPVAVALIRDELNDDELARTVRRVAVTMKWRLRMIRRDHTKADDAGPFPGAESWPTDDVAAHSASLSARITALRAKNESDERKQMRAEFDELSDRAWLSVIQEDVIAEIGRRKKRAELEAVGKDTATNRITIKSGEIAEQLVTNALRAKFSKEIDKLAGISILPAPDGTFIHPRAADPTKLSSSHNRPAPEAVTSAPADVQPTGAPYFQGIPQTPLHTCGLSSPGGLRSTRRASASRHWQRPDPP